MQGMEQLSVSPPAVHTLATSNFNRHYSGTGVPSMQHVLFGAVHLLLVVYCRYKLHNSVHVLLVVVT
jgi:hypothetical protein